MSTSPTPAVAATAVPVSGSHPIRRLWARWLWLLPLLVLASAALVVALAYGLAWGEWLPLVAAHALAGLVALVAPPVAALLWWALWRLRCAMLGLQDQAEASQAAAQAQLQRRAEVAALSVRLQQAQSSSELADTLLSQLAQLLPVRQALCALWHDSAERTLVAAARYGGAGADAQAVMTRLPRLGTLLHECALQRQPLRIPEPGAGFPRVSSGLGDMAPAEIVLYPVQYGGQVFAVLELAVLRPLTPEDLQLLADIEPVFAMGLDIVQRADRTERLLDEARAASEHSGLMLAQAQESTQHQHMMLANISREVRGAMNAVVGLSHVLLHSPLQPAQQRAVHHVLAAGRHLLAVLNDMLDFSRAQSGQWQLEQAPFSVSTLLQRVAEVARDQASAKGLAFGVEQASGVPERLLGNAPHLAQVLGNYCDNAVKFTAQGGVTLALQLLQHTGTQVRLRFEVSDTGIGLTEAQQARLWEPLTPDSATSTREDGSVGLGLVVARMVVERMGGTVGVRSAPGQGAVFWCELELALDASHPPLADPAQRAQRLQDIAGARVLVVEDDPIDQEVATELLRDAGFAVDVAAHGEQALQQLQQRDYDLVFIDLRMPVLDGFATAQRIRQQPRWAQLPLVALTANVLPEDVQRGRDAGMNDHMAKPIEPELLLDKMLQWVQPHATEESAPCN